MIKQEEYLVYRDTREKDNQGWFFDISAHCLGTESKKLDEGDYTIKGFEKEFIIERKGSISEFAQNIIQPRFHNELERLDSYKLSYLILEFDIEDIVNYPHSLNMNKKIIDKIKLTGAYLTSCLLSFSIKYKTKILFAGKYGRNIATILFKKVANGQIK